MSNLIIQPWEMGTSSTAEFAKNGSTRGVTVPLFCRAKYVICKIAPTKSGLVRDGLVLTSVLMSFLQEDGTEVVMTEINDSPSGQSVTFPNGKIGLIGTKFRGPYNDYKFFNRETKKVHVISKDELTTDHAKANLSTKFQDWDKYSVAEQTQLVDQYFEDFYMFSLARDLNLNIESQEPELPFIGMVTEFYRQYIPPKEDEKYGRLLISKYFEGHKRLPGEYSTVDAELAAAILTEAKRREDTSSPFDGTSEEENSEETSSDII